MISSPDADTCCPAQVLPLNSLHSIANISNGNNDGATPPPRRQHRHWHRRAHRPSVAIASLNHGTDAVKDDSVTIVAACTPPKPKNSNSHSSEGRISLAIYNTNKRSSIAMKYSRDNKYKTVCLVPKTENAILLATDTFGNICYCNIPSYGEKISRLLDMQQCSFSANKKSSEELSRRLIFTNTLTARSQMVSSNRDTPMTQTSTTTFASLTKKSRKRKGSSRTLKKSSTQSTQSVAPCQGIYVVASSLNTPSLAPTVMYLSNDTQTSQWQCVTSCSIPIKHNSIMQCITFLSKQVCAALWDRISHAMKDGLGTMDDEGVILMGFQDGSLQACIVHKTIKDGDVVLQSSRVATLLEANGAALLSVQLVSRGENPIVVCARENGITVLSSDSVHEHRLACESRVISMSLIGYQLNSLDNEFSFLGVHDTGRSFFHRVIFRDGEGCNWKDEQFRLPLTCGVSVCGGSLRPLIHDQSRNKLLFAMADCSGKVILFKLQPPGTYVSHSKELSQYEMKGPILSSLMSKSDIPVTRQIQQSSNNSSSTYYSLMTKLESAILLNYKQPKVTTFITSTPYENPDAMRELRDAIRVSSKIMNKFSHNNSPTPWKIKMPPSKTGYYCAVTGNDVEQSNNWDNSIHVIQLCPMQSEVCCRLGQGRDYAYTKVLYGGVVQSYVETSSKDEVNIQNQGSLPIIFGSLQMKYTCSESWYAAKSILDFPNENVGGIASRCPSVVHLVPILTADL